MTICSQCEGSGKVVTNNGQSIPSSSTGPSANWVNGSGGTTLGVWPIGSKIDACPSCLGNGYMNCFGAST